MKFVLRAGAWRRRRLGFSSWKSTYDVVVVGGGAVGSSIGLQLALHDPQLSICVIERDPSYMRCSAILSAGGLRQQFGLAENVALSIYGAWWLKEGLREAVGDEAFRDPAFKENGYLTLARDGASLRRAHETQRVAGADWIEWLPASSLPSWLNADGLDAATFGSRNEGYFDAHSFLSSTVAGAKRRGVTFVDGHCRAVTPHGAVLVARTGGPSSSSSSDDLLDEFSAGTAVVASGAGSRRLVPEVPIVPRLRSIFVVHCDDEGARPPETCPLVIDPSGCYFRADGAPGRYVCGTAPPADWPDPDVDFDAGDFDVDYSLFDDVLWPTLADRVPAFQSLKLQGAWSGLYEVNLLDHNAVVGPHPDQPNLILAAGFSGHGLQHAPAVGRAVAELITSGTFQTIDLSPFAFDRLRSNTPLREHAIY